MTTGELLLSAWDWEPSVVAGCGALVLGYFVIAQTRAASRTTIWFLAGVLTLLLDLVSPIDLLGDIYLFSSHVLQHFVLAFIVPIFLLKGMPRRLAEDLLKRPILCRIECRVSRPPASWLLGVGAMVAWHIPVLFNAALADDGLHIVQHLSFLVTGMIFWWPVVGPLEDRRLEPLSVTIYLFSACTTCSLLGAVLTFSPPGAYPVYLAPDDRLGGLALIRGVWGLDAKSDQQLGGMLMWVPGCLIYLSVILASFSRWYAAPERYPEEDFKSES